MNADWTTFGIYVTPWHYLWALSGLIVFPFVWRNGVTTLRSSFNDGPFAAAVLTFGPAVMFSMAAPLIILVWVLYKLDEHTDRRVTGWLAREEADA